jgi:hypothetical protein
MLSFNDVSVLPSPAAGEQTRKQRAGVGASLVLGGILGCGVTVSACGGATALTSAADASPADGPANAPLDASRVYDSGGTSVDARDERADDTGVGDVGMSDAGIGGDSTVAPCTGGVGPSSGASWSPEPSYAPTAIALTAVWGSSASDVWVVGKYGAGECCEIVISRSGKDASPGAGPASAGFSGLWGTSASDVWLVGATEGAMHWDGTSYSYPGGVIGPAPSSVWGTSASDVWAVGDSGLITHWNGSGWTTGSPSSTTRNLRGVWGSGKSDVWAVGDSGTILHWNGSAWSSPVAAGTTLDLWGVWGADASHAWAVGAGTIVRWDGTQWSPDACVPAGNFKAVWGSSATDVWAVGDVIVHWDGTAWSLSVPNSAIGSLGLVGVWGASASDVWAVGGEQTVLHYH